MLHIPIDRGGSLPVYKQIYQWIKNEILQGKLEAETKIPSKRTLSTYLNVSQNSVLSAYNQLIAEGYIYTKERSGYFVETIHPIKPRKVQKKLDAHLEEGTPKKYRYSFSHMSVDASLFPFQIWRHCEQRAILEEGELLSDINHSQGIYKLREILANKIRHTRGVICEPEQIVIGASTQWLLQLFLLAISNNKHFAMEEPGYYRLSLMLEAMNHTVYHVPVDHLGMQVESLRETPATIAIVTPSHQMPTGSIMPVSRRTELLHWSYENKKRYIIEDDYDSEFKYEGGIIPSLQSLDEQEKVIYIGTFSKSLLPDLRVSYMILPLTLLQQYKDTGMRFLQTSSTLIQLTLSRFLESGEYDKHIKRMSKHYKDIREKLMAALQDRFGDRIQVEGEKAGLHFLLHLDTEESVDAILARAEQMDIELYSIQRFLQDSYTRVPPTLIIGFAKLKAEEITQAVDELYKCCFPNQ
ncbi:PLP-dependent aminotransferase family protein [Natribacillus halophilus]|uniref:GntR family transcriptional regulator / MocR family aminotransferase n=1 Tax=Natribacillus halophilus TaxID=549003 RepID=A0A1G8P371_9BACI|nr:PLP-dependent aminotransferase family protein [Natribacillus halophilus]SDI86738.1 GntR family transcriptional regulator / MocR family aminotransferase [Natribacillus halophilus]